MSKLKMLAVHDSKVGAFMQPWFARSIGEAMRTWETVCNEGDSMMAKYPEDHSLFEVGEFDDQDGSMTVLSAPRCLSTGIAARKPAEARDAEVPGLDRSPKPVARRGVQQLAR